MNRVSDRIQERRVVLPDGRYLIFYTSVPADQSASLKLTAEKKSETSSGAGEH
jgi:hypothetical protein